jgi:hypothetical protein
LAAAAEEEKIKEEKIKRTRKQVFIIRFGFISPSLKP